MRILEFKDYCGKLVLRTRILTALVVLFGFLTLYFSLTPKVADVPESRYLLFALYKFNYTPDDYEKTFLKMELPSPFQDRRKLVEEVKRERIYSYFRPLSVLKTKDGVKVCGYRVIFTDSPSFTVLRRGRFCVELSNVQGKVFIRSKRWK